MTTRIPLWTTAFLTVVMIPVAAQEKLPAPEKPPAQETQPAPTPPAAPPPDVLTNLDRATADLTAHVVALHYTFTSRPIDTITFIARYRAYDVENRSDPFLVTDTVSYDPSVSTYTPGRNHVFDMDRKTFDAEMSYTPLPHTALRFGYTRESVGQTFRHTNSTDEDKLRFSTDLTGISWLTLRPR
jgi:hypothetical protein